MLRASTIHSLPAPIREWLDNELANRGFAHIRAIADEVNKRLEEEGDERRINRFILSRYAKDAKDRNESIKDMVLFAKALSFGVEGKDPLNSIGDVLVYRLLSALVSLDEEASLDEHLARLQVASSIYVTLVRACAIHAKALRDAANESAALSVEKAARARGLSDDEAAWWRDQVLVGARAGDQ